MSDHIPAPTPAQARRRIAAPTAAMLPRIGDSLSFVYLEPSPRERR